LNIFLQKRKNNKGYVNVNKVLKYLAKLKEHDSDILLFVYELAKDSGILKSFQKRWNKYEKFKAEDLDWENDYYILSRKIAREKDEEQQLKEIEGKLILMDYI